MKHSTVGMCAVSLSGIPCFAAVTNFFRQDPMGASAYSDLDCYGYTEVEFEFYDRKGYRAHWLDRKYDGLSMTAQDMIRADVLDSISTYH